MPAKSKAQQRLMGMAYSVKKGDSDIGDIDSSYRDKVKDLVDGMSLAKLKDYASTDHTNLPDKVEETSVNLNPNMNVPGMGDVVLPGNPGDANSFAGQTRGSGDIPFDLKKKKKKKKLKYIKTYESFILENKKR
jgi:hypothetical protein